MRIVTLNTWCGKLFDELLPFLKEKSHDTDVFCFQEVLDNKPGVKSAVFKDGKEDLVAQMKEALPDFVGYSAIPQENERGLATFVKSDFTVEHHEDQYVYGSKGTMVDNNWSTIGINMLYTRIRAEETYHIWNLHGAFVAPDKMDYPKTLEQAKNIRNIVGNTEGKRILCGDFNLDPTTESMRIIESIPLRNLVKEYKISSTRTKYYTLPSQFADYIMPSSEVNVNGFGVLDSVVSDHFPLWADIN